MQSIIFEIVMITLQHDKHYDKIPDSTREIIRPFICGNSLYYNHIGYL